jgi:AAA15 family ATPase/GTPase
LPLGGGSSNLELQFLRKASKNQATRYKMLLRFGVSNNLSIRDYQELSLVATSLKDPMEGLLRMVEKSEVGDKERAAVPVVAIYGANAAGKSTILRALNFYVSTIQNSHTSRTSRVGTAYQPFLLDDESREQPSRYDADFIIEGMRYHYGFVLDGKIINEEWLYSFPPEGQRQARSILFHRDSTEKSPYYFGKSLKGDNKIIAKLTRDNSLFLSSGAQNAHPQLSKIYDYFKLGFSHRLNLLSDDTQIGKQMHTYFSADDKQRAKAMNFMKAADIGISDIHFSPKSYDEKAKLMFGEFEQFIQKHIEIDSSVFKTAMERTEATISHAGANSKKYEIEIEKESSGTKALFQLLGPVFTKLERGGVLIVDELNVALHPLVSQELIKLFSNPQTNPGQAQLIFTTHDTSILTAGLLRRDQIWFVEKDSEGSTVLYALSSIKIRKSDNFEKGYIEGRFGAIPMFGLGLMDWKKIGVYADESEQ